MSVLTDDEKRELIAEAEEFVKYGADLNPMEAERLIGELCGALAGTPTEPEWQPIVLVRTKEAGPDAKWEPTVWDPAEIETARQGWPEGEFKLARMILDESEVPDV